MAINDQTLRSIRRSNRVPILFLFGVIVVFFLSLIIYSVSQTNRARAEWKELIETGISTEATVAGTYCSEHGAVFYEWELNGKIVQVRGNSCGGYCDSLFKGKTQKIVYAPKKPWVFMCANRLSSSEPSHYTDVILGIVFMVIIIRFYTEIVRPNFEA